MLGNLYIILSILTFAATSLPIYSTHPTYFTFWMVYTSHDWGNAIIYNLVIAVALFLFRFVEAVVFGGMREDEAEKLYVRVKVRLIGVLVITMVEHRGFNLAMFVGLVGFVLVYAFHQMLCLRSEYLFRSHHPFISDYFKVSVTFALLLFFDYQASSAMPFQRFSKNELPSKLGFSFLCMLACSLTSFISLFICSYERFTHCEFPRFHIHWFKIKYWLEIGSLVGLAWRWGVTLPQAKEVVVVGLQLVDIFVYLVESKERYVRARELNQEMGKIRWITQERLKELHDSICTICFRDIQEGRELNCKHVFHDDCLKLWLETRHTRTCPKCKQPFDVRDLNAERGGQTSLSPEKAKPRSNIHTITREPEPEVSSPEKVYNPLPNIMPESTQNVDEGRPAHTLIQKPKQKTQKESPVKQKSEPSYFVGKPVELSFSPKPEQKGHLQQAKNLIEEAKRLESQAKLKIGSLPYGLPTEAVYRRTKEHFGLRNAMNQREILRKMFSQNLLQNRSKFFQHL